MGIFLTRYLPALIWAALIAAALLTTGDSVDDVGAWLEIPEWLRTWVDRAAHLGLFLVLALLVRRCFQGTSGDWGAAIKTLAATLLYIVILEAAQTRIPGRGWESQDVVVGIAGVLMALYLSQRYQTWRSV